MLEEGNEEAPKADLAKMQAKLKTKRVLESSKNFRRSLSSARRYSGGNIRREIRNPVEKILIPTKEMELYNQLAELWKSRKERFSSSIQEKARNFLKDVRSICDRFSRNVLRKKIACEEFWKQWNLFNEIISKDITQRITGKGNEMKSQRKEFIASLGNGEHPTLEGTLTAEKLSIFWELLQEEQKENESTKMHKTNLDYLLIQMNELKTLENEMKQQLGLICSQFEEIFGAIKKEEQEDSSPKKGPRKAPVMSPEERQELEKLNSENTVLKRDLKTTLDEKRLLEKKLKELQEQSNEETQKIQKMIKQMRPKKKAAETAKLEFTALSEETTALKQEFERLESEAEPLRAQIRQYETENIEKSEARIKSLTEGNESLNSELTELIDRVVEKEEIVERLSAYIANMDVTDKIVSINLRKQLHGLKYRSFIEKHYSQKATALIESIENEQQQMSQQINSTEEKIHSRVNQLREIQGELVKYHRELIDTQYQNQLDALHELRIDLNHNLKKKREHAFTQITELRRNREELSALYKSLQGKYNTAVKGHKHSLPNGLSTTDAQSQLEGLMQQYAEDGDAIKKISLKEAHDEIISITNAGARIQAVKDKLASWMSDMNAATNALKVKHTLLRLETQIMAKKLANPDFDVAGEFMKRKNNVDSENERLQQISSSAAELLRKVYQRLGGTADDNEPIENLLVKIHEIL